MSLVKKGDRDITLEEKGGPWHGSGRNKGGFVTSLEEKEGLVMIWEN
jgi:hypothetical protein